MNKICLLLVLGCGLLPWVWQAQAQEAQPDRLTQARAYDKDEDFQKGLELCRSTLLDPAWDGQDAARWLPLLVKMMHGLDPIKKTGFADYDMVLENVAKAHPENWRVLVAVAIQYQDFRWSWGCVGKNNVIVRCQQTCPGGIKASGLMWPHDRARGLQLFEKAIALMSADATATPAEKSSVYLRYGQGLLAGQAEAAQAMDNLSGSRMSGDSQPLPVDLLNARSLGAPAPRLWDRRFVGGQAYSNTNQPPPAPPSWPTDAAGKLAFSAIPATLGEARDDIGRWRWALAQAIAVNPLAEAEVLNRGAQFCEPLFGMDSLPPAYREFVVSLPPGSPAGLAWHPGSLADDEALAWLNGTIHRVKLPADLNPVAIYARLAELGDVDGRLKWCRIFESRCQFGKAAAAWRQLLGKYGEWPVRTYKEGVDALTRPVYSFKLPPCLALADTRFPVIARNTQTLNFTARRLDLDKALVRLRTAVPADNGRLPMPDYFAGAWLGSLDGSAVSSARPAIPWEELLLPPVVWQEKLEAGGTGDFTHIVKPPFHDPGAWFLEMKAEGGSPVRGFVCITDLVQLSVPGLKGEKQGEPTLLAQQPDQCPGADAIYYLDAETGKPQAEAKWLALVYQSKSRQENQVISVEQKRLEFPVQSDAAGRVPVSQLPTGQILAESVTSFQAYLLPRNADGSLALWMPSPLNFSTHPTRMLVEPYRDQLRDPADPYMVNEEKALWDRHPFVWGVLERPVYAAGDLVRGRFWAHAKTIPGENQVISSLKEVPLSAYPVGDFGKRVRLGSIKVDDPAGLLVEYRLPAQLSPTAYIVYAGEGSPLRFNSRAPQNPWQIVSFSVGIVPAPVQLKLTVPAAIAPGATLPIAVSACLAQGKPKAKAKVNLRVYGRDWEDPRTPETLWTPLCGASASWLAPDADHFPDWKDWGWPAEPPAWLERFLSREGRHLYFPSMVSETEKSRLPWRRQELLFSCTLELDERGQAACQADTGFFNAFRNGRPLQFCVMAELEGEATKAVDETLVFSAARPGVLRVSTVRGFQRPGTAFQTEIQAYRLDGAPLSGPVKLEIQRVTANRENQPEFMTQETRTVVLDAEGKGVVSLTLGKPGQYRLLGCLACGQQSVPGGTLVLVKGETDTLKDACFKPLELVVEKGVAGAGDAMRLLVNSCYSDATILLFVRAEEGYFTVPRMIRMEGKSHEEVIEIRKSDPHQIFVHAEMVKGGQLFQAIREIPVAPLDRWLSVMPATEISPDGHTAKTTIRVTNAAGAPVANAQVTVNSWNQSLESRFWPWVFSRRLNQMMAWKPCLRHWIDVSDSLFLPARYASIGQNDSLARLAFPQSKLNNSVDPIADRLNDRIFPRPIIELPEQKALCTYYLFRFASGSEAPLRPEDFPVWQTGLATDAEGKVTVEWPLPQKPGTWRLRISCQAAGRRFGDAEEAIKVPANPPTSSAGTR